MKTFLKVLAVCSAVASIYILWLGYVLAADATFADETGRYD